ncbi:DNA mismatch repair protein MutS [Methylomarinovum caldicuralii]|uniref:DNA mismatch repair protein MutS n=1 Tax=Methylomarinovum caldicuralii TaxID=438856 RepID=A0AAU9CB32_9GAMM|nr:DNA mismatch repair protein MutS [Methylomarinovum caldicuralii]BCX81709.1 DNA mismatch repair protein MutS [Methylomarinovum caldicuralii]
MRERLRQLYTPFLKLWREGPETEAVAPAEDGVIDPPTYAVLEVPALYEALDTARTQVGKATLHRSLARPLRDAELIRARQAALRELQDNPELRRQLADLLANAARRDREPEFYKLLYCNFLGGIGAPVSGRDLRGYGYEAYVNGTRFVLESVDQAQHLPEPQSPYLQELLACLRNFAHSRAYRLMTGPVYRTEKRLLTREEKGWLPAIRFRPSLFKPVFIAGLVGALLAAWAGLPALLNMSRPAIGVLWLFLLPIGAFYPHLVGTFDRDKFIYPLRRLFREDPDVQQLLETIGYLDELLALHRFAEDFGHPTCLPEILDDGHHRFVARELRNPILGKGNPAYVPNDIELDRHRLTFITGPNSGGKTAICKTIAQSQLLAQIGAYVPAREARMTVADRIFYQVPEVSQLTSGEGRFATELRHTKEIFLAATPRSLVILDELAEGTTYEERLKISYDIMEGFHKKGCTTLLVTHNHQLVDKFIEQGIGQAKQVEFVGDHPTHRLIDGISRVSHADRVAKEVGFSKEDIDRYLGEESP